VVETVPLAGASVASRTVRRPMMARSLLFSDRSFAHSASRIADRVVDIVGITTRPDEAWMLQASRNLTDSESGAMRGKRYLILDQDTKCTDHYCRDAV